MAELLITDTRVRNSCCAFGSLFDHWLHFTLWKKIQLMQFSSYHNVYKLYMAAWHLFIFNTFSKQFAVDGLFTPLGSVQVMVIVWRLRENTIRTAVCWIVWHSVHSQQRTYMSSSYRSNRLGVSHWDPYAVHRGCWLELYYCNVVEWFWWDSSLIDDQLVSFSPLTLFVWSSGL